MEASACTIAADLSRDERSQLLARLEFYNNIVTDGLFLKPGVDIDVGVATAAGEVVGGVNAGTQLGVMFLEVLWVADDHRDADLGALVLREAERIARAAGCRAAQTWTFSFQAPRFYEKQGYRQVGFFDGYPDGIAEHVLVKRLGLADSEAPTAPVGYRLISGASPEEMKPVLAGFHEFCVAAVGEAMDGIAVDLALRDGEGRLVGGVHAWTTLQIVVPECLWIDSEFRGLGYGTRLMTEVERIAREVGCISAQTGALSFQSPGFFENLGYETYGVSDAYPDPFKEWYFIKRFA